MTVADAQGWAIIIGAIFIGVAQTIQLIFALRNRNNFDKLDSIRVHTDGMSEQLVKMATQTGFTKGVEAQKVVHDAAEGQERRIGDTKITPGAPT